ncbi:hypothetical protein [Sorangium sp. So ce887]|uniref:hypothetical protein n=1 Tax=Sorangium sp. So ce887 TaxID=3133324 RepID=UPI003F60D9E5
MMGCLSGPPDKVIDLSLSEVLFVTSADLRFRNELLFVTFAGPRFRNEVAKEMLALFAGNERPNRGGWRWRNDG